MAEHPTDKGYELSEDGTTLTITKNPKQTLIDMLKGSRKIWDKITKLIFNEQVTEIPAGFCAGLKKLETVKLSIKLTEIGNEAFKDCSVLTTVNFKDCTVLTKIGDACFQDCSILSIIVKEDDSSSKFKFNLPPNIEEIGRDAFRSTQVPDESQKSKEKKYSLSFNKSLKKIMSNSFAQKELTQNTNPAPIYKAFFINIDSIQQLEEIGHNNFKLCKFKHDVDIEVLETAAKAAAAVEAAVEAMKAAKANTALWGRRNEVAQIEHKSRRFDTSKDLDKIGHRVNVLGFGLKPKGTIKFIGAQYDTSSLSVGVELDTPKKATNCLVEKKCFRCSDIGILVPKDEDEAREEAAARAAEIKRLKEGESVVATADDEIKRLEEVSAASAASAAAIKSHIKRPCFDPDNVKLVGNSAAVAAAKAKWEDAKAEEDALEVTLEKELTATKVPTSIVAAAAAAAEEGKSTKISLNLNKLTLLGEHVFSGTNITHIESLGKITTIPKYTFYRCNFRELEFEPASDLPSLGLITEIGDYAFSECWHLHTLILSKSIIKIGKYAFSECYRLKTIDLTHCINHIIIGANAFLIQKIKPILTTQHTVKSMNKPYLGKANKKGNKKLVNFYGFKYRNGKVLGWHPRTARRGFVDKGGLEQNDRITKIGNKSVTQDKHIKTLLAGKNKSIEITVERERKPIPVIIKFPTAAGDSFGDSVGDSKKRCDSFTNFKKIVNDIPEGKQGSDDDKFLDYFDWSSVGANKAPTYFRIEPGMCKEPITFQPPHEAGQYRIKRGININKGKVTAARRRTKAGLGAAWRRGATAFGNAWLSVKNVNPTEAVNWAGRGVAVTACRLACTCPGVPPCEYCSDKCALANGGSRSKKLRHRHSCNNSHIRSRKRKHQNRTQKRKKQNISSKSRSKSKSKLARGRITGGRRSKKYRVHRRDNKARS